jgi:NTP pyrophosphatase (non-canonical NTP hydrolase)
MDDLESLAHRVWEFREARDWAQFHHPKELASALSIEVSEIMELFRFRSQEEVSGLLGDPDYRQTVGAELADSLFLLLLLSRECGVDLRAAFERKLALLETRYPVEQSRGRNAKWTEYSGTDSQA